MRDIAVKLENLNKNFVIYHENRDSIKKLFLSGFKKSHTDKFEVLKNINIEINKGEFFGIIGRNGSGKSTLLKIIAGIYNADSGKVIINGKITPFLELGVGFNPDLTARENIFLNGIILGSTHKEIESKFDSIVDFAEVRNFIDMQLKTFSSGMQVRLAFSIAIHTKSEILIIDELLAVGDASFQQKCFDVFERYKREGKTIIFVSHDLSSVRRFCDRAAYIKNGLVKKIGPTAEVLDQYIYEDRDTAEISNQEHIEEEINNPIDTSKQEDKPLEINNVVFFDKNGKENNTFSSGDDIKIDIQYINRKNIPSAVFGIQLFNQKHDLMFGTNSLLEIKDEIHLKDTGNVHVTIKDLPLNNGSYLLTIAAHDRNGVNYEWLDKKYQLNILPKSSTEGILRLDTKWE